MNKNIKSEFRIRSESTTRIETFFDAAFAFAITMLVISVGSIPRNYNELILAVKNVPSFAISFAGICWFWFGHRRWSRWYGLEDTKSILLTLILIFIMLVYVYPLRLIFSAMLSWMTGGWLPSEFELTATFELTDLFIFYGIGFFALCGNLVLLYKHGLSFKEKLRLNAFEQLKTRFEVAHWLTAAITGLFSALFAFLMPQKVAVFAGFIYATMAFSMPLVSILYRKKLDKLES